MATSHPSPPSPQSPTPPTSREDALAAGRAARKRLPRSAQSRFAPPATRDPLGIITEQNLTRLPELVDLRLQRMVASPFAFFRGTAALQAADMAHEETSGISVTVCGDAHLNNFEIYSSPQRTTVFDLNDFDEAAYGAWEWDLKRFVTSLIISANAAGAPAQQTQALAHVGARSYRRTARRLARLSPLERYYIRTEVAADSPAIDPASQAIVAKALRHSRKRTSERAFAKITRTSEDGGIEIVENPPTLQHVGLDEAVSITDLLKRYRASVLPDIAVLLDQYRIVDVVLRVVGVGSVGTRCYLALFLGPNDEPLILQVKEASESVLRSYGTAAAAVAPSLADPGLEHGSRVVSGQRILQAVSDPFLGHLTSRGRAFYVRQFRDGNTSFDTGSLTATQFTDYARACGSVLARAHLQSPGSEQIAGYLGKGTTFDTAVVEWGGAYARQSLADYELLREYLR